MTSRGLVISGLSVRLGARTVLDHVSLTSLSSEGGPGELICVLGPNGAGKTTLLRAIAGLAPAGGRLSLDGVDLVTLPTAERARLVAYLPQGHIAHWPIAARHAVAIGRVPHGGQPGRLSTNDLAVVDRALAAVDAAHLADRPVTELSGGERARIMLARALAVEAPVLLADEAIAALDPGHQLAVMGLLRDVAARGTIVLAALHDLTLAARFAARVLVIDGGRIAADGTAVAVLTPDLLQRVFGISAVHLQHDGQPVILPWSTRVESRR